MQIHRPRANGAATRQRNHRIAEPRQKRPKHEDGCAHPADKVIGRDGVWDLFRLHRHGVAVALHLRAMLLKQLRHGVDVGQARHVRERDLSVGQERRREQGQRRILGAADRDLAVQWPPTYDADAVHDIPLNAVNGGWYRPLPFSSSSALLPHAPCRLKAERLPEFAF